MTAQQDLPKEDRPPEYQKPIDSRSSHHATPTSPDHTALRSGYAVCRSVRADHKAGRDDNHARPLLIDGLQAKQRRRTAAVRLPGGDPDHPGAWYHRPSTGLRASGFREGFTHGALDVLRELWPTLDDQARARAAELAVRYENRAAS
ncbi:MULTISPECIES: hypothetical protein [Mycobacterium]|uniref:hypothetical protein n=1 Tax=Mycobacterium TaxID=1763 RepID=UPI00115BBDF2|nr:MULTISPECIES: hypothetical protein [Mycobacterium]MCV7100917.1 hypothetical protein [Mycobacterium palustre]MDV3215733.1 hypothetical protein [Mycobacterium avium]